MRKNRVATLIVVALAASAILTGCNNDKETESPEPAVVETESESIKELEPTDMDTTTAIDKDRSYLTGEMVGEAIRNKRPFAAMLNNIINACPQSGIEKAAIVYEAPVEGAITRLMGIFEDVTDMDKIGSIRSCRTYYPMYAMEFDAIYTHFGQAVYAVELLNSDLVDNISGLSYQEGAGDIYGYAGEEAFYRSSDRPAPHNCYTSGERLDAACTKLGYRRLLEDDYEPKFKFAEDNAPVQLEGGNASMIKPGYEVNAPWFEYKDGVYYRYQYGEPQIDELSGEQLSFKNIIFQISKWENYDENGYLNIDTLSGGDGYYFTNGTYEKCTWSREDEYSPAHYYNSEGEEIVLNPGKTWICIIQDGYTDAIVIE